MRESAISKPRNEFIHSFQLDQTTHDKLLHMVKVSGMSKSKLIRILIMSATLKKSSHLGEPPKGE